MTHCDRLLDALADGEEHDHISLYRLGMILHSRVSDLRKRGYVIEIRKDGDTYWYRLAGRLADIPKESPSSPRRDVVEPAGSTLDAEPCHRPDDGAVDATLLGSASGVAVADTPVVSSASTFQLTLVGV